LNDPAWRPILQSSYSIYFTYILWDTPEYQSLGHTLQWKLKEALPIGEHRLFHLQCIADANVADAMQKANSIKDLAPNLPTELQKHDVLVSLTASLVEKQANLRSLNLKSGRFSPKVRIDFSSPQDMIIQIAKIIPSIIGMEAYIFATDPTKNTIQVVFRGPKEDLQTSNFFCPGTAFWVMHENRRVADTWVILGQEMSLDVFYGCQAETLGNQRAQIGQKLVQIYFTGGDQKFRLVNQQNRPQPGFSIFSSYQEFSTEKQDYITTTEASGEFTLSDRECRPLFLVIAKNVEGINFAFFRKMIVVQDQADVQNIVITDAEVAQEEAREITAQRIQQRKTQEVQRQIYARIEQAREHIQKKELPNALIAIKLAQQNLRDLPEEASAQLSRGLKEVEEIYEKAIAQKKANEDYVAGCRLLDEMDQAILNLDYATAKEKLQQIQAIWPQDFYGKEYAEVVERANRLVVLEKESNTPLGMARRYVMEQVFKLRAENIEYVALQKLYPHLKVLYSQGNMDKTLRYNDLELWLKIRLQLNDLSQQLAQKGQQYLTLYNKAVSVQERTDLFEKHQKCYQCSRTLDEWLKEMR